MMIFVDGTWLYYSLFSRGRMRCPIIKQYGMGWVQQHSVAWREVLSSSQVVSSAVVK